MKSFVRQCCGVGLLGMGVALALAVGVTAGGEHTGAGTDFDRTIRPILSNNCFQCHGPDSTHRQGGLRLDLPGVYFEPAESGVRPVVPGKPEESELMRRVESGDPGEIMPPPETNKVLTPAEKEALRAWIAQGAPAHTHWAFAAPQRPPLPSVTNSEWPRVPLDHFILARLEAEGLHPSPEADRTTLIRRLTLDLTGLPPTPAEVDAFLADTSGQAYEIVVDRLLANPHYGERMALDWLDAGRFADTHGFHIDSGRDMTLWRDGVIDAFNQNQPFDQFTVEQLAGDLLPEASLPQRIASGFNRNHMINFEGGAIPEEYHNAYLVDRVNTTATVWLGMTVACAQCHEHKYDPLTQKEYYQLYAFFNNVPENGLDGSKGNAVPLLKVPTVEQRQKRDELDAGIQRVERQLGGAMPEVDAAQAEWEKAVAADSLPEKIRAILAVPADQRGEPQRDELRGYYRDNVSPDVRAAKEQLAQLRKERDELEKQLPTTMVMEELPQPRETFVRLRGQYDKLGEPVTARVPAFLPPLPEGAPPNRLGLARWLVHPSHPLTARVTVNRYWQMFFGVGLVRTAEDFGSQGERPSHPELLDWLAVEFQSAVPTPTTGERHAWNVKALVKQFLMSAAYRQSSAVTPELAAKDPDNRLLARGPRVRLQAEFIRDQALAVSGLLNDRIGGHSVSPYQPPGIWEELASRADGKNWTAQEYVQSHGPDLYRRTMYTFWKRTAPPPSLMTFDAPDRETCVVRRARTNTPLQALVLWNDPTYVEASRKLAERMLAEAGATPAERIRFAFRLAVARLPREPEVAVLQRTFDRQLSIFRTNPQAAAELLGVGESPRVASADPVELAAWTMVASAILNLDETLTKG